MISNDIALSWDNRLGQGNWQVSHNDLVLDNALHSAVMISLFTDRLAPLEPDSQTGKSVVGKIDGDRRGWWGDMLRDESMGSRLWQLKRGIKADRDTLVSLARDMIYEALQWMVDDGLVGSIKVEVQWAGKGLMEFTIELMEPMQNTPQTFLFSWAWEGA